MFSKKPQVSRMELRETLRRSSGQIPGTSRRFSSEERVKLEREFGSKYGEYISASDVGIKMGEYKRERAKAKTYEERTAIDRKINYLRNIFGVKK